MASTTPRPGQQRLQQAWLVRCRKLPSGEAVYSPLERDLHHVTCVQCGDSQALPLCPLASGCLGLGALLMKGFRPLFHTFEIYGLCSRCQQAEGAANG